MLLLGVGGRSTVSEEDDDDAVDDEDSRPLSMLDDTHLHAR